MNIYIRRIFITALSVAGFSLINYGCKKATHGFNTAKISYPLVQGISKLPSTLMPLQNKPFYYLGKGAQAFVFVSSDKTHVVKFLRFDHLYPKPFVRLLSFLPYPYIQNRMQKSEREIRELLTSFQIAQDKLSPFTQVKHIQLCLLEKPLILFDKLNIKHEVIKAPFIVQPYASPFYPTLETFSHDQIIHTIDQISLLLATRFTQGIYDDDPNLETNFGFVGSDLIEFDIGRFSISDRYHSLAQRQNDTESLVHPLRKWLELHHPDLVSYLDSELLKAISI